jgi:hypothetical protein
MAQSDANSGRSYHVQHPDKYAVGWFETLGVRRWTVLQRNDAERDSREQNIEAGYTW